MIVESNDPTDLNAGGEVEGGGSLAEDSTRKIHAMRCQEVRTLSMEGMVWASVRYQAMARTEFLCIVRFEDEVASLRPA